MNNSAPPENAPENPPDQPARLRSQLGPLLLLTAIFFANFMARIVPAPLMPTIEKDLGLSHADAGGLFLVISIGYFVSLIGSGFFSARFTHKTTIVFSAIAMGIALLGIALCRGVWELRMALLFLGLTAGLYLPSGIATLTAIVDSRHWGKAIAIHELAPNMSLILAPLVAEFILQWFDWRTIFIFLAVMTIFLGVLSLKGGEGGKFSGKPPDLNALGLLFKLRSYWLLVILFGLGISSSLGIFTMLPLYLVAGHGFDQSWANTIISFSRLSGVVAVFAGGWIADRFGPIKALKWIFLLTGGLTVLMGLVSKPMLYAVIFLQPVLSVCFFPAGFAALALVCPPQVRHLAVSFTAPMAFLIGGGLVPTFIGAIGDLGSFSMGIATVGVFIMFGAIIARFLKAYQD